LLIDGNNGWRVYRKCSGSSRQLGDLRFGLGTVHK
jgi:hypothetical protein